MIDINKTLKKTNKITESLVQRQYGYIGLDITILEVDYLNKKFLIERRFQDTVVGRDGLEDAIKEFNTEEKVKKYFGLK